MLKTRSKVFQNFCAITQQCDASLGGARENTATAEQLSVQWLYH